MCFFIGDYYINRLLTFAALLPSGAFILAMLQLLGVPVSSVCLPVFAFLWAFIASLFNRLRKEGAGKNNQKPAPEQKRFFKGRKAIYRCYPTIPL